MSWTLSCPAPTTKHEGEHTRQVALPPSAPLPRRLDYTSGDEDSLSSVSAVADISSLLRAMVHIAQLIMKCFGEGLGAAAQVQPSLQVMSKVLTAVIRAANRDVHSPSPSSTASPSHSPAPSTSGTPSTSPTPGWTATPSRSPAPLVPMVYTIGGGQGRAHGFVDGTGAASRFHSPNMVTIEPATLDVIVTDHGNSAIRRIHAGNGSVTTFPSPQMGTGLRYPYGTAFFANGDFVLADGYNHCLRRFVRASGQWTDLAGTCGEHQAGFAEGVGPEAKFHVPMGVAIDGAGNVYASDHYNHRIRKITQTGLVSTFAGSGGEGAIDGPATSATFRYPAGVAFCPDGFLYVAESGHSRIRKISPSGVVSTVAGGEAGLAGARGITCDGLGNVYVADMDNSRIRKVAPSGLVTTVAGTGAQGSQDGPGSSATFFWPHGVVASADGRTLYVADEDNHIIRRIDLPLPPASP